MKEADRVALISASTAIVGLTLVLAILVCNLEPHSSFRSFQQSYSPKSLSLLDTTGLSLMPEYNLEEEWLLVYFGCTRCPDVYPKALRKFAQALRRMENEKKKNVSRIVFVSVDPERDSPEVLRRYLEGIDDGAVAVLGSNTALAKLARFFGADYGRAYTRGETEYPVNAGEDMPASAGQDYRVDHSPRIFVVNPRSEYIGSFPAPHDVESLVGDMKTLAGSLANRAVW